MDEINNGAITTEERDISGHGPDASPKAEIEKDDERKISANSDVKSQEYVQKRITRKLVDEHEETILKDLFSRIANVFRNEPWLPVMLLLGTILGISLGLLGYWNVVEPVVQVLTIIFVVWAWIQTRKREVAGYQGSREKFVLAVEVGRPVSEAVKNYLGSPDDREHPYDFALIEVNSLLGKSALETDSDYEKMAKAIYSTLARNQNKELHLFLSGPVGMNFLVGQMVGTHKFEITVYQYHGENKEIKYLPLPHPARDWLKYSGE